MTIRNRTLLVAVLSLLMGFSAFSQGSGGPRPGGTGGPGGGLGGQGRPSREFIPPDRLIGSPGADWPQPGRRPPIPGEPSRDPERVPGLDDRAMALSDAVSKVQERFNATAVKTDTVMEAGQLVYRIRLLSADKSRVWTVSVDARTGRVN